MRKQLGLAAIGLAGLTAGAGAGLVLTGGSGGAAAQTSPTSPDTTAPGASSSAPDQDKAPGTWLKDALAPLVEKGTITQAQADAVIAAIEAARPPRGDGGHRGPGGPGGRGGFGGLDAAATAMGITSDALRTTLEGGQTIAQVAKANGVDLAKVTDAMLAAYTKHEQDEVTAGQETQAKADEEIAAFKARVDEIVNATMPSRGVHDQPPTTTTG